MATPFLLAETPRGGPFGHRFIIPPETHLRPTDVEAYFQRAALGQGTNFIAVNHQVVQHLPNGSVRQGAETLLLAGLEVKALSNAQAKHISQLLNKLLPDLEELVAKRINWEATGPQTLIIRDELTDWIRQDITGTLARSAGPIKVSSSQTSSRSSKDERAALLIGGFLALVVGAITLFFCFF